MRRSGSWSGRRPGFTAIELVVVVVTILVLAGLVLVPMVTKTRKRGHPVQCSNNLKQTVLAFRMFSGDNDDRFPYFASKSLSFTNRASAWIHFQVLSNELASPRIILCPQDLVRQRNRALDFTATNAGGFTHTSKRDNALSYFLNLSADETMPNTLLVGDRNIAVNQRLSAYSSAQSGAIHVSTSAVWSVHPNYQIHTNQGYYGLSDGSVQFADSTKLQTDLTAAAKACGTNANWFLFPQ